MKKNSSKKPVFIAILIIFVISIFAVPILINESYKSNKGYMTLWEAKDLLSYFGSVISAIGTIFIGIIAFEQSCRANDINDRLLKLEEVNSTPFLHLDISGCRIQCFEEREIDILVGLRNETNSVINIIEVSKIKADPFLSQQQLLIPFCKGWSNYYSVLPHETKEINFFNENKHDDAALVDLSKYQGFIQLICKLEIKLHFVNSTDIYIQKFEFYLHIYSLKGEKNNGTNYKLNIFSVDNSIEKEKNNR